MKYQSISYSKWNFNTTQVYFLHSAITFLLLHTSSTLPSHLCRHTFSLYASTIRPPILDHYSSAITPLTLSHNISAISNTQSTQLKQNTNNMNYDEATNSIKIAHKHSNSSKI